MRRSRHNIRNSLRIRCNNQRSLILVRLRVRRRLNPRPLVAGRWICATDYKIALANSVTWLFTFIVAEIGPPTIEIIEYKRYIIFAVLNVAFGSLILFSTLEVCTPFLCRLILDLWYWLHDRQKESPSIKLIQPPLLGPQGAARIVKVTPGAVAAGKGQLCAGGTAQVVCGRWWWSCGICQSSSCRGV